MNENRIMVVYFGNLYESICNVSRDKKENEIENVLISIEESEELKQITFYQEREDNKYYLTSDQVENLINLICNKLNETNNEKLKKEIKDRYVILDYFNEMYEDSYSDDEIELGNFSISKQDFYASLSEETMEIEDNYNRLINAEDFNSELNKLKKETLEYLLELEIEEAKRELGNFEF